MRFRNGKGLMYVRVVVWVLLSAAPISMHLDSSSLLIPGLVNLNSDMFCKFLWVAQRYIYGPDLGGKICEQSGLLSY